MDVILMLDAPVFLRTTGFELLDAPTTVVGNVKLVGVTVAVWALPTAVTTIKLKKDTAREVGRWRNVYTSTLSWLGVRRETPFNLPDDTIGTAPANPERVLEPRGSPKLRNHGQTSRGSLA